MNRRTFIQATLATTPVVGMIPDFLLPKADRVSKGFVVKAGEGRHHGHIQLAGVNVNVQDVKVSGKDTNGDFALFEQTGLSPGRGVPLHIHPAQDELFRILDGEYHFQVGDEKHQLKAGDAIFLPRNVAHAWIQVSQTGRTLVLLQPAGKLEEFFLTMAGLKKPPTPEELAKHFADNEMKVVGPPMKLD